MSWVSRDGFSSGAGRFVTVNGRVDRQDGASLRAMFLPTLTREGQKALRDHRDFIRAQLHHYGVAFDEYEFSGRGVKLMKEVLEDGYCDQVPPHILELETQMHREWLNTQKPAELADHPEWIIDKYFARCKGGQQPDRTITSTVVEVPYPWTSNYRVSQMEKAADEVAELHHATATGPKTKTVFLGWNKAAVKRAAQGHAAKEKKGIQAAKKKRETQRAKEHADYRRQARTAASPVGSYSVDCADIEEQWDQTEDLCIDIHDTGKPGVFEAEFDFGVFEGVMILSADETALARYCAQEDEDSEDDAEEDEEPKLLSKRKTTSSQRGGGSKKAKSTPSRKYFLKMRGRETGEGEIMDIAKHGTVTFKDAKLMRFEGRADMARVGSDVVFTARKVSDTPGSTGRKWADYSNRQYERERVGRWH